MLRFFLCLFLFNTLTFAKDQLIIEPDAGREPILSALHNTHRSIDLAMYGLTDPIFLNALVAEKKAGKNINVLLEPQPYRAETENHFAIARLRHANIPLQFPHPDFKLIHQKTFILDQQKAIIMTFNLTRSTFKNERNFAVIIDDPAMIKEISQVFTADWQHKNITVHHPHLIWSPNNSREKIIRFIHQANATLDIYAQDISDYKIIGALAKAARHGTKIKILLSNTASKKENKKFDYLRKAGVIIRFSKNLIHAKVMIADQQYAMIGSINLTRPSLDSNRELSIITQDTDVIRQLENTFNQDWRSAEGSFSLNQPEIIRASKMLLREVKSILRRSL